MSQWVSDFGGGESEPDIRQSVLALRRFLKTGVLPPKAQRVTVIPPAAEEDLQ